MQRVSVLDKNNSHLAPCTPARARILLSKKEAFLFRNYPFTIKLKNRKKGFTNIFINLIKQYDVENKQGLEECIT